MTLQIGQEVRPNQAVAVGQAPGKEDFSYGQVSQTAPAKIKNVQNVNGVTYYDVDQTGIGGGTGWVRGDALEAAMGGAGANPGGAQATQGAISSMMGNGAQQSSINLDQLYKDNYQTPEIQDINKKVSDVEQKLVKAQEDLNMAQASANDNPWLSETMRRGEFANIKEKSDNEINKLTYEKATYQDQLAKKQADAQIKLNLAMKQYDINRQEYQDNLQKFNFLMSSGALSTASGADIAQISLSTGIPTSMIDSIVAKQKRDEVKPQAITSEDDYGNQTVNFIDANNPTNIIATHTFKGVSKKTANGTGTDYDSVSNKYLDNALSILKESDTLAQRQGGESNPGEDKGLSAAEATAARERIRALVKDPTIADQIMDRAWNAGGYWLSNN